jgi:hypothetical protein
MNKLNEILSNENTLLDSILFAQKEIREAVKTKNWINLEDNIASVNDFTSMFLDLDKEREVICESVNEIDPKSEEGKLLIEIRGKLFQSKVMNKALNDYVGVTRNFVQNILDNVVPQRRSVVYSRTGKIVKPQPESVVLNKVF